MSVSYSIHMFIAMSHWSTSRTLVLVTLSITRTPLQYLVVALCHGNLVALDLRDWPLHVLQQCTDEEDVDIGHLKALYLGLGGF